MFPVRTVYLLKHPRAAIRTGTIALTFQLATQRAAPPVRLLVMAGAEFFDPLLVGVKFFSFLLCLARRRFATI
jgi:hypothetical protein